MRSGSGGEDGLAGEVAGLQVGEHGGGVVERAGDGLDGVDPAGGDDLQQLADQQRGSAAGSRITQPPHSMPITVRLLSSTWFSGMRGISPAANPTTR